jgi:uncharacterized repeat protein (TIGR03847 family)
MAQAKNEFTSVTGLRAASVGEPGKRTFRIMVDSASSSASLWLEKEQLFQLALAIQQMIAALPKDRESEGGPPTDREASALTRLEFKVAKLVLGHDGNRGLFIIDAHDPEDDESATVRVWASLDQAKDFSQQALSVCASGRPLCPLCGKAIDPSGHRCARVNGHVTPSDIDL